MELFTYEDYLSYIRKNLKKPLFMVLFFSFLLSLFVSFVLTLFLSSLSLFSLFPSPLLQTISLISRKI